MARSGRHLAAKIPNKEFSQERQLNFGLICPDICRLKKILATFQILPPSAIFFTPKHW
jgi:hypothetical protein